MDDFAFFFDAEQIIEEVHLIEPPRKKAPVYVLPRKRVLPVWRMTSAPILRWHSPIQAQGP